MKKFNLQIQKDDKVYSFQIVDYFHHEHDHCKFEIFENNKLLASLEPDRYGHLHVCKNPGNVREEILYEVAERIESFNWHY